MSLFSYLQTPFRFIDKFPIKNCERRKRPDFFFISVTVFGHFSVFLINILLININCGSYQITPKYIKKMIKHRHTITLTHTHKNTHSHSHKHTHKHTGTSTHTHKHTNTHTQHTQPLYTRSNTQAHTHIHTHKHTHTHTNTCAG